MYRKLSLVLAFLLLFVSAAALADDFSTYENETDGYRIDYPADWTLLSQETIGQLKDVITSGGVEGIDASVLDTYAGQIDQLDMVIAMGGMGDNFNIIYQDMGIALTNDLLISMLAPQTIAQFKNIFSDFEVVNEGSVITFADNEFVEVSGTYSLSGVKMTMSQYYMMAGSKVYIISFTKTTGDDAGFAAQRDLILESFVPAV